MRHCIVLILLLGGVQASLKAQDAPYFWLDTAQIATLEKQLENPSSPLEKASLLNRLARKYKLRQAQKQLSLAEAALLIAQKLPNVEQECLALLNIGEFYVDDGQYAEASKYFLQAQQKAQAQQLPFLKAVSNNKLGVVAYFIGDYDQAILYQQYALAYYEEEKMTAVLLTEKANILSLMGYLYQQKSNYVQAFNYYQSALEIREQLQDKNELAKSLNAIGDFYLQQNNLVEAKKYFNRSLDIAKDINNPKALAISKHNLALLLARQGAFEEAESLHFEALRLKEKLGIKKEIALSLQSIALLYALRKEKIEQSEGLLRQAYEIQKQLRNRMGMVEVLHHLSEVKMQQQEYAEALAYLQEALPLIEGSKHALWRSKVYYQLFQVYLALEDLPNFARYYKLYQQNENNNPFSEISSAEVLSMQKGFEYQQQEKEIQLLRQEKELLEKNLRLQELELAQKRQEQYLQWLGILALASGLLLLWWVYRSSKKHYQQEKALNERLRASEEELRQANALKDRFLSVVSHDLRSPLVNFASILQLLRDDADIFSPEEFKVLSAEIHKSVNQNIVLLENLLNWSKTQSKVLRPQWQLIRGESLIQEVLSILGYAAKMKRIHIEYAVASDLSITSDANMLKSILLNLLQNAIKFTPEYGKIEIEMYYVAQEENYYLRISDTGRGLSSEKLQNLLKPESPYLTVSEKGTKRESGTGLGFAIVKDFVRLLDGDIQAESQKEEGTSFLIRLPLVSIISK